jgi:ATP-dependent Clp protease ATP-binding subunit ClpA
VIEALMENGIDSVRGARGLSKARRDLIETPLADILIDSNIPRGSLFEIGFSDNKFTLKTTKPQKKNLNNKIVEQ